MTLLTGVTLLAIALYSKQLQVMYQILQTYAAP
mgnify:CR=1 FL=1